MPTPLLQARYLSLATFRKNGQAVATPVWFAAEGDHLYVFSSGEAGKVKRLRNSPRARIAPCTVTGALLGDWQDTEAVLLHTEADIRRARAALTRRYGWQMHLINLGAWLSGRIRRRAWIAIACPDTTEPAATDAVQRNT